jgi:hypothetical protein
VAVKTPAVAANAEISAPTKHNASAPPGWPATSAEMASGPLGHDPPRASAAASGA